MLLYAAMSPTVLTAVWGILGVVGVLGLLALASPKQFASFARRQSTRVAKAREVEELEGRLGMDVPVARYSRALGGAVLATVVILSYVVWTLG